MLDNADMASDLDVVVGAGLDAMAVSGAALHKTGIAETVRLMAERSVVASSYQGGVSVLDVADSAFDDALRKSLTLAAALGAPTLVVVSGLAGDRSPSQADEEIVARLTRLAPLAQELGVRMAIEPLHPFLHTLSYVHTLGHAAEIASRVEGCGVALDLVHTFWDRCIDDDIDASVHLVSTVHVGNLSKTALDAKTWRRSPPDDGVVPVERLIRLLHAAGYRGFYELEVLAPSQSTDECQDALRSAGEWFAAIWDG